MSMHLITVMVDKIVNPDEKTEQILNELQKISFDQRKRDKRLIDLVVRLKEEWSHGTKIERLATLGWQEYEACQLFSEMIENIDRLRCEYREQTNLYGKPDLSRGDSNRFEKGVSIVSKNIQKK